MGVPQAGPNFRLSNSTLSVIDDCARCGWDHVRLGVERPDEKFPSITRGIDSAVKRMLDRWRAAPSSVDLQSVLAAPPGTRLWGDVEQIRKVRAWQTGMAIGLGNDVRVVTALDDLLEHADGTHSPLDGKSKGSAPVYADAIRYYEAQGDLYSLALEQAGRKPSGRTLLLFVFPSDELELTLVTQAVWIKSSPPRALERIKKALAILRGPRPPLNRECTWCTYRGALPAPPCPSEPGPVIKPAPPVTVRPSKATVARKGR